MGSLKSSENTQDVMLLNLALKQVMSSWTCFRIRVSDFSIS